MAHEVRLAYMILAHRLPEQLVRFVERLSSPRASFLIHVNRKTPGRPFFAAAAALGDRPDVHLLRRVRLHWGLYGHVEATLIGLAEAIGRGVPFDHFVLLTGQDYPIKPREAVEAHFERHRGTSFMEWFRLPRADWPHEGGMERISYRHYRNPFRLDREPEHRLLRVPSPHLRFIPRQRLPDGYRPYEGSAYWSLSREAALYVHDFARANRWYRRFMKRVLAPEEFFFQTLIMNSPHAANLVNDDLHYVDWSEGGWHPAVLEPRHLPELAASDALFARKFDSARHPETLDLVDRELLGITTASPAP
jgi:core-2/I-Branching enzyme